MPAETPPCTGLIASAVVPGVAALGTVPGTVPELMAALERGVDAPTPPAPPEPAA